MKGTVQVVDDSAIDEEGRVTHGTSSLHRSWRQATAPNAFALVRAHRVELIMCDINMPVITGLELLQQIENEKPAVGVPLVVVTTKVPQPQIRQAILLGARGYIRKPLRSSTLKTM